jgi:hypothetical protein
MSAVGDVSGLAKIFQGFALNPGDKEVKIEGVSVLPSRKPTELSRKNRAEKSPIVNAAPSDGASM